LILGRLHQVEYAIEAINNAGTCVGLQCTDGIVLCAERKVVSKLLAPSKTSEKTYTVDDHVVCLVAGLTSDANILINQSRLGSQRFLFFNYFFKINVDVILIYFSITVQVFIQVPRTNACGASG